MQAILLAGGLGTRLRSVVSDRPKPMALIEDKPFMEYVTRELVRSGIAAVDPGQMEAGRSLGLSRLQSAWHIVLPQAMKNILPAIGNEMIALLKETAVAGYVAVQDLTRAGNLIRNNTYDSFNPLMLVAVVYLVLVIGMTQLLGLLERRLRRSDQR